MHFLQHRIGENSKLFHVISSFCWGLYYYFAPHLKPHQKKKHVKDFKGQNTKVSSLYSTGSAESCQQQLSWWWEISAKESIPQGIPKGVPLTYVYPWYLLCSRMGFLGTITHKYPIYRAYSSGFPMTGYVGIRGTSLPIP